MFKRLKTYIERKNSLKEDIQKLIDKKEKIEYDIIYYEELKRLYNEKYNNIKAEYEEERKNFNSKKLITDFVSKIIKLIDSIDNTKEQCDKPNF
jgi:hypothetical protein